MARIVGRAVLGLVLVAFVATMAQASGLHGDATRPLRFNAAKSWGFQLQHITMAKLVAASHDVLVVDYSKDGTEEQVFTPAELAQLKRKPDGSPRIVLAYLSIGEAENYRYYWHWTWGGTLFGDLVGLFRAPPWLGPENGEWRSNYAVRYWRDDWQHIFLGEGGYLDRIIASGFDGVYLDKVDTSVEAIAEGRESARDDMRTFVVRIAERARAKSPGFLIVPQNGEELLEDPAYVRVISGMGKEDLLYGAFKEQQPNPADHFASRIEMITPLRKAGKPVLAIEYIDRPGQIAAARTTLTKLGYVATFADRDLGHLRTGDLPDGDRAAKRKRRKWWFF